MLRPVVQIFQPVRSFISSDAMLYVRILNGSFRRVYTVTLLKDESFGTWFHLITCNQISRTDCICQCIGDTSSSWVKDICATILCFLSSPALLVPGLD